MARKLLKLAIFAVAFGAVAAIGLWQWPIGQDTEPVAAEGDAERGAYLARMAGCISCHTNSAGGGSPLAGGVRLKSPYGTFVTPNITTDPDHGIGAWSVVDFDRAVRQGISPEGEPYYPAFPYLFYAKLSDQDVADLWVAFRTVAPVAEDTGTHDLAFPFDVRFGLKLWRALYFQPAAFQPDPAHDEQWNRGAFIVTGPSHCGACHTPRNLVGARDESRRFAGAGGLPGGDKSPAITTEHFLREGWNAGDIEIALELGILPDGDTLGGSMGEVVRDVTSFFTAEDLKAVAAYLMNDGRPPAQ